MKDLLCWRGYALYDTAAEFRSFWLVNKFQEEGLMQQPAGCGQQLAAAAECGGVGVQQPVGGSPPGADADVDADTDMAGGPADVETGAAGARARRQEQHHQQAAASFRSGRRRVPNAWLGRSRANLVLAAGEQCLTHVCCAAFMTLKGACGDVTVRWEQGAKEAKEAKCSNMVSHGASNERLLGVLHVS